MIAREAWQHTLTCELRRRRPTGPPGALPRWQHTLTCELRHEDEATAQAIIDLATYAYVRVATKARREAVRTSGLATYAYVRVATPRGGALAGYHGWQHTLTCELRHRRVGFRPHTLGLATYAYVRVATEFVVEFSGMTTPGNIRLRASCDSTAPSSATPGSCWQHTLTCELRLVQIFNVIEQKPGNIRLRASCDGTGHGDDFRPTTGNIRLRASCDP